MKSDIKPVIVVQGGQYGSEAKGLITAKLVHDRKVDIAVRTGTVNAGHTVYYKGRAYPMQQLPVAWVRPKCTLVLGPGAYIHPDILQREIDWVNEAMPEHGDVRNRLYIDRNCGIHTQVQTDLSTKSGRHYSMGATGKGSSEAVIHKIRARGGVPALFSEWLVENEGLEWAWRLSLTDTTKFLNLSIDAGHQVLVEGTQGTLLDLHLGPYPYVTHKQTQAASWMAEAGLSCTLPVDLVLVMRTHPIRVAGNSGPLPREISWFQLGGRIDNRLESLDLPALVKPITLAKWDAAVRARTGTMGDPAHWSQAMREAHQRQASEVHRDAWVSLSDEDRTDLAKLFEMTTVTRKLRRIANWDADDARRSIMLNRPTSVALTFMNYLFPEAWGVTRATFGDLFPGTRQSIYAYIRDKEVELGCPISLVGFGPQEEHTFALYHGEGGEHEG